MELDRVAWNPVGRDARNCAAILSHMSTESATFTSASGGTIGDVVEVWRGIFQWLRHFGRSSHSASFPPPCDVVRCLCYLLHLDFAFLHWGIEIDVCHGD